MHTLIFMNFFTSQPKEGEPRDYEKLYNEAIKVLKEAEKQFEEKSQRLDDVSKELARARMAEEAVTEQVTSLLRDAGKYRMIEKIVTGSTSALDLFIRLKEIESAHGKVEEKGKEG